jgi:hypothetical protein
MILKSKQLCGNNLDEGLRIMSLQPFSVWLNKNILASLLTALEILSSIRHLLHNSALLFARIVRYFHIPALMDIHSVILFLLL